MSPPTQPLGRIVSFYSYKGGTGRSMAVANVAWILAANGYKVLAIDWDLEAPGLHRYFRPFLRDPALNASPGLIDFFIEFADAALATTNDPSEADWFRDYADLRMFASALDWPHFTGRLDFVGAGRQDAAYSTRINSFNWHHFYAKLGGGVFLEETKRQLREEYDYILIDSRTGVSDTSGICTVQMPDRLVVCFTLNEQSIAGAASTAASAAAQRRLPSAATTLRVMPVPTRVDQGEKERADVARLGARAAFDGLLDWLDDDQIPEYWAAVETPYLPFYAFEEVLAVFGDPPGQRSSMLASMEGLTSWISDKDVQRLPAMEELLRLNTRALFMRPRPKPAAAEAPAGRYMFYVSYADPDEDGSLGRFIRDLQHEIASISGRSAKGLAYFDRVELRAGDDWMAETSEALDRSELLLELDSPTLRRSQSARAEHRKFVASGKPIVTVPWIPVNETGDSVEAQPGFRTLRQLKEHRDAYAQALEELARDLLAAAKGTFPSVEEYPPEVLVAVLAERKGGALLSGFATGTYGMRRRDWAPFSTTRQSIAELVAKAGADTLPQLKLTSLHKLDKWLRSTPRKANQGAILILDPGSLASRDASSWLSSWLHTSRAPLAMISCDEAGRMQSMTNRFLKGPDHEGATLDPPILATDEASLMRTLRDLAERLPRLAGELAEERRAWHPEDDLDRRGELNRCMFSIPGDWRRRSAKRWLEWGDVLVQLVNPPNSDLTYLLPSGRAPESLRAPKALREDGGLPRKQAITEAFIAEHAGRELQGFWFYRRMADDLLRVQVYCPQYDEFLNLKQ